MIEFIFYSFLAACLELAFQEYMQKEMILEWYRDILISLHDRGEFSLSKIKGNLYKKLSLVLGLCRFCNGFWVAVIVYIIHYKNIEFNTLLFCSLNFVIIMFLSLFSEYLHKKIDNL